MAEKREDSKRERFNHLYETGAPPWELDRPDNDLMGWVAGYPIEPCKTLELGCGTGVNALWLAGQGFEVTGIDFSPFALEKARANARAENIAACFMEMDFLREHLDTTDFSFVFDRGCFHSFDDPDDRAAFAQNVHRHMAAQGLWLSFLGSADAPPRNQGPPMRSALDIVRAVEPWFEILTLTTAVFDSNRKTPARNWHCFMRKRSHGKAA
ncbi:MAG: class I SAM-dependent methyltransferase [Desulfobacter sp.]|nr:MAG: class I SAM-dependent methyltransferase [Desulfobacter sp.]